MSVQIPGYTYTTPHQAVVDAVAKGIPQEQWEHLPRIAKMLLVVVLVTRNQQRYCDADGFLKLTFPDLLRQLRLITVNDQAVSIRIGMQSRGLYVTNGKAWQQTRLKLLVNPEVQACLDELAGYDQSQLLG